MRKDMEGGDKEHRHAATSRRTTRGNDMHDVYDWVTRGLKARPREPRINLIKVAYCHQDVK